MKVQNNYNKIYDCLVILGMARSGSSTMSRLLNLAGANLGKKLRPPDSHNPKGYWENTEILRLHDLLRNSIGTYWDDIRPLPEKWWKKPAVADLQREAIEILRTELADSTLWLIKDMTMSRFMKFWFPVFRKCQVSPYFIIMFRNPYEVSASWKKMTDTNLNKSMMMWLWRYIEAESDTRPYPRKFVAYDTLIQEWRTVFNKISEEFKIDWPVRPDSFHEDMDSFLDNSLRHHVRSDHLIEYDDYIIRTCFDLYDSMKEIEQCDSKKISLLVDDTRETLEELMNNSLTKSLIYDVEKYRFMYIREREAKHHKYLYYGKKILDIAIAPLR